MRHPLQRMRLVLPAVLAGALAVALPAVVRADDWATPGLDGARSRSSAERSGAGFTDGHWSFAPQTQARALASPVVAEGFAASADLDGTVSVVRADSGKLVWSASAGAPVQGTPAIAHGRLFVPTLGNKVVAFGLADGAPLWSTNVGGMTMSSPAPVGSDIVFAAGFPQHRVLRLDGATGALLWQSPAVIDQPANSSPAVSAGLVVVGSNGGHYYAFDAATGAARWDYQADGVVHLASPLIVGGRVYMAGGDDSDRVHAVDAATGTAVPGWPVSLPAQDPDVAGTRLDRHRAVSSFTAAGGNVVLETRLDDLIDSDGDGLPDQYLSRETVVALDAGSGAVVWQRALGRVLFTDPNDVPKFFICPTPAAFGNDSGTPLLAVASSLAARVSILDAASGADDGDLTVAGRALASPVMANGRIITVAESNVVEGQLSSVASAAGAGAGGEPATARRGGRDPALVGVDGSRRGAGDVRAADRFRRRGAGELRAADLPRTRGDLLIWRIDGAAGARGDVHLRGAGAGSGGSAVWMVDAGDVHGGDGGHGDGERHAGVEHAGRDPGGAGWRHHHVLGRGRIPISETLQVGGGVSVRGAGAGRSIIDATGLPVGISFGGTDPKSTTVLDKVTVTGAATCVAVSNGARGVQLTHLVVRDCATAGISVAVGGGAGIVNATVVGNGIGVDSSGVATIKNSLVSGNAVGLKGEASDALASRYDDLFGNTTAYVGLTAGTGDLTAAVTFADLAGHNLMLSGPQASTDRGDPADDVGAEPTPNGARINLGAFGGTADAELSTPAPVTGDPGSPAPTPSTPTTLPPGETPVHQIGDAAGGCALGGRPPDAGSATSLMLVLAAMTLAHRRKRARSRW